jgi:hypothetical protein
MTKMHALRNSLGDAAKALQTNINLNNITNTIIRPTYLSQQEDIRLNMQLSAAIQNSNNNENDIDMENDDLAMLCFGTTSNSSSSSITASTVSATTTTTNTYSLNIALQDTASNSLSSMSEIMMDTTNTTSKNNNNNNNQNKDFEIKKSIEIAFTQHNLIGDRSREHILPVIKSQKHQDLFSISPDTVI